MTVKENYRAKLLYFIAGWERICDLSFVEQEQCSRNVPEYELRLAESNQFLKHNYCYQNVFSLLAIS